MQWGLNSLDPNSIDSLEKLLQLKILPNRIIDFDNGDKIRVLTSDYLANGGDKMWFFQDKEQIKVGLKLRDVIIDYCNNADTISSKLDNRLIIKDNE